LVCVFLLLLLLLNTSTDTSSSSFLDFNMQQVMRDILFLFSIVF